MTALGSGQVELEDRLPATLDPDGPEHGEPLHWLRGPGGDLNERFAVILLLPDRPGRAAPGTDP